MTLNDLTVNFQYLNRGTILEEWEWLIGKRKLPILIAASGDAFVQDTEDGTVHILDVAANQVNQVAKSFDEFKVMLSDRDFIVKYLNVQLVGDMRVKGLTLKPRQIYSFIKPPVLGGQFALENIEVTNIDVHFSITGQIGRQVKDIPPGTPIKNITITKSPKSKSRWKFWQ
jgi:hypothetical protein